MANVIKHKRGSGSDPVASDLVVGEVAIRTDVGKLFTKMDNGTVAEIAGGGSDIAINTLSSSSGTGGGSATFNGSAYRFTLSAPPSVSAQQLLVSINGVIQKPVAGTGQPSEGFSVDGTDIILGDAPATGSDFFILTFKSLGVSEPADNSVTSAKIVDGAIVNADINASAAIAGTKISPDFGSQNITTTGSLGASGFSTTGGEIALTGTVPRIGFTDSNANSDFRLKVDGGSFQIEDITNSSADRLVIDSSGHVGIGTVSPETLQHNRVNTFNDDINKVALTLSNNQSSGVHQYFQNASTGSGVSNGARIGLGNTDNFLIQHFEAKDIQFSTNGTERMRITSAGNVGIGTTSPSELLQVAGTLECNNIKFLTANKFETSANVFEGKGTNGARLRSALSAAGTPSFSNSDDTDTGMFLPGSNVLGLSTGGSERLRIDSSGNVGIGTTNPQGKLGIGDTGNNGGLSQLIKLGNDSSGSGTGCQINMGAASGNSSTSGCIAGFFDGTGTAVSILTSAAYGSSGAVERFRVDSSGNAALGTSTIADDADHCKLVISGQSGTAAGVLIFQDTSNNEDGMIFADNGNLYISADRANATADSSIRFRVDGSSEKMRIHSDGLISVNTTDADNFLLNLERSQQVLKCDCTGTGDVIGAIFRHGRGGLSGFSGKMVSFRGNDNTEEGSIVIGTTATAFNTSSDYRLKENEVAIPDGITRLKTLKPYQFNFKKDPGVKVDGFFAHEVSSVVPVAVTGLKDAVVTQKMIDDEAYEKEELGNPIYQGIDHSKLVPLLVAALQEAIGRIEALEAK